jgi:hypothetical protein
MRTALLTLIMGIAGLVVEPPAALAAPRTKAQPKPVSKTPEQKLAERHFQSGVALFKEAKYAEALAEFERAYEISPQPLVLYNIAGCHRELSHYSEAVTYYGRFLADGKGKVKPARLAAAQAELDGILARVARVTVIALSEPEGDKPAPDKAALDDRRSQVAGVGTPMAPPAERGQGPRGIDVTLLLDGTALDKPAMPLILPPGEHRLVARADGRRDAERSLRLASGDDVTVELVLAELPAAPAPAPAPEPGTAVARAAPLPGSAAHHRFALGAGFGMDLRRPQDSGAPSLGLGVAVGSRLELGVDALLVAYALIPSVRARIAGDALSLHAVVAVPVAFNDGPMTTTFAAFAIGLGLRLRATPSLAFRLESFVSFAGEAHGTTVPTFLGGELWF